MFDTVIIGGGIGGSASALRAAQKWPERAVGARI